MAHKKGRQARKKEKKAKRVAHAGLGRSITPSNDTKDMTSMISSISEGPVLVGELSRHDGVEDGSSVWS